MELASILLGLLQRTHRRDAAQVIRDVLPERRKVSERCRIAAARYKSRTLSLDLSPGSYFWGKST